MQELWLKLFHASRTGDVEGIHALAAGADPNCAACIQFLSERFEGSSPLLAAAWAAQESSMRALLAAGAEPNLTNHSGDTPLLAAAYNGMSSCVEALLQAGADVDIPSFMGVTALGAAAF